MYAPDDWETKAKELQREMVAEASGVHIELGIESRHWRYRPDFPLKSALNARASYALSDETVRALVEMHYRALKSLRREGSLFFLTKGLEIVREMLPGRRLKAKQRNLPADIIPELRHPLAWLYSVSNNRFETRHILRSGGDKPVLHPRLTNAEYEDFEADADLVLRTVACIALGLEPFLVRAGHPPGE